MTAGTETATAAYAVNVGTVGIVGTLWGMPLDALFLGAFAGFLVLGFNPPATRGTGMASVCAAMLLAGALSPALCAVLARHLDLADDVQAEADMLRPLVAVAVGGGWQWALPHIAETLKNVFQAASERLSEKIRGKK